MTLNLDANKVQRAYGGIPVGDYELFFRATGNNAKGQKAFVESNLIQFKILGVNPGKNRVVAYIDTFPNPTQEGITYDLKGWYKAILQKESAKGAYSARQDWDQFERNKENGGVDIGFGRSVFFNNVRYNWNARYGFPFASVDNGYGIAQLTGNHDLPMIARWKNTVRRGWELLTETKLSAAVAYLKQISDLPLNQIPADVVIRETVRRYHGGREYVYQNNTFVSDPASSNPTYVNDIATIKADTGY